MPSSFKSATRFVHNNSPTQTSPNPTSLACLVFVSPHFSPPPRSHRHASISRLHRPTNLPPLSSPQSRSNTPTGSPLPRCHCSRQVRTKHTIRTASLAGSTPACISVLVYRHPRLLWAGFRDSLYRVCNRWRWCFHGLRWWCLDCSYRTRQADSRIGCRLCRGCCPRRRPDNCSYLSIESGTDFKYKQERQV